ncbi:hypothetical protein FA13DRAFT_1717582 [Coprinellus micaceus]|uniref:WW domain-containing protein n=1 Tax=Coprinellus micaceus TaxID=71717 RepID=A0A4Y7SHE1_COPMI|nr:hypothetical protein FA13DRAFT_1717582 [Coprinellus micaceus]
MDPQSSTVKAQSSNAQESPPPRGQGDIEMGIIEISEMRATATDEGTPQRRTTTDTVTGQLYSERIIPMVPEFFQRYDRIPPVVDPQETKVTISALTYFERSPLPEGWEPLLHPEGVLYFFHPAKNVVTEVDLYDPPYYARLTADITAIEACIRKNDLHLPENYTLAIELDTQPDGQILTGYYFTDHQKKIVFFLDDIAAHTSFPVWEEVKGVTAHSHILSDFEFTSQYWIHGMLYPSTVPLANSHIEELRDTILFYIGELRIGEAAITRFTLYRRVHISELDVTIHHVRSSRVARPNRRSLENMSAATVADVWVQQTFSVGWLVLILLRTCSSSTGKKAVGCSHSMYTVETFGRYGSTGRLSEAAWKDYATTFQDAQREYILYATVLLGANVAFLAIQTVDVDNIHSRSPIQIASYMSTVFSIGCIVMGLLLVRQPGKDGKHHPMLGPEIYAILYSIPYSLLIYSMVAFSVAFGLNCFQDSNTPTKVIVAVAWSIPDHLFGGRVTPMASTKVVYGTRWRALASSTVVEN